MLNNTLKCFAQKARSRLVGREKADIKIKLITNADDDFKTKVESLLAQEQVVTNPVHYLMDDKVYGSLDSVAKERYLLTTLDKYNLFKNEIENISSYSKFCM